MTEIFSFILLFLLPFTVAPFGVTQFENPKVVLAEGLIILLLISKFFQTGSILDLGRKQIVIYLLIFAVTIFDLIFLNTSVSFFGNAFRMQGIFLLWMLLLFSFLSSHVRFSKTAWWVFALLLYIQIGLSLFLPINESGRYVGTLGEPNALGSFSLFVWPFAWFAIKRRSGKSIIAKALLILGVLILLYLSGSRSATIGFGIQLLFLVIQKLGLDIKKAAVICLIIMASTFVFPFFERNPYENRVEIWRAAVSAGWAKPILGHGFGNTEIALQKAAAELKLPINDVYFDSSHNVFLDWWVQGGIAGLGLLLLLIFVAINKYVIMQNGRELVLLLGLLTALSFNPASVVGLLAFWWLIGRGFDIKT